MCRNSVKLRLTLYREGGLLFPRFTGPPPERARLGGGPWSPADIVGTEHHGPPPGAFGYHLPLSGGGKLQRPRRPDRRRAEPLDQGLGAIERGEPGFDVAQPRIVRLGIIRAHRRFHVPQFPS